MSNHRQTLRNSKIWIACLWPGLARLWYRGDLSALVTAVGFTLLLNLALLSTFLWTRWPADGFPIVIWPIVAIVWIGSAIVTFLQFERIVQLPTNHDQADDTLLIQAQTEYLKGNWSEVQTLIARRLKVQPRDVAARLLWATLFRRTGRLEKAVQQLDILDRFDESVPWRFEIERERAMLENSDLESVEIEDDHSDSDPVDQREHNLNTNLVKTSVESIDDDQSASPDRKAA